MNWSRDRISKRLKITNEMFIAVLLKVTKLLLGPARSCNAAAVSIFKFEIGIVPANEW